MTEDEQIMELMIEAQAYGLDEEIKIWALKEQMEDTTLTKLQAFHNAYNKWIK